jgi:ribosomal protein S18 acetylase RimI-like enzyme
MSEMEVTEKTVDLTSSDLDEVIDEVLALQSTLVVKPNATRLESGFLVSPFARHELERMVKTANGKLICLQMRDRLAAFALLTDISEFTLFFGAGTHGTFNAEPAINYAKLHYLYQIAVDPQFMRRGLGGVLIKRAKALAPYGLIADILIEPLHNASSIAFFERNGFAERGVLHLDAYRDFGKLKSKVFEWRP